jgi:hypothetical protein
MSMFVRNEPLVARYKANMYDNIRYQPLSLRLVVIEFRFLMTRCLA